MLMAAGVDGSHARYPVHEEGNADRLNRGGAWEGRSQLIIFAGGPYELFVRKLEVTERSETALRLLPVRSLAQLKGRIASLILSVLAIGFFQRALALRHSTSALKASPGKTSKAG